MRTVDSGLEEVGGSQTPSQSRPSHTYPRPEVDEPPTATTALNKALGADVRPGAIARSDDAPHIWSEINNLSRQIGRLEKQVELTSGDLSQHRQVIDDVKRDTQSLCTNHDKFRIEITASGSTSTQAIQAAEQRLSQKLDLLQGTTTTIKDGLTHSIDTAKTVLEGKIGDLKSDLSTASTNITSLQTEQASNAKLLKFVSVLLPVVGLAFTFGAPWIWKYSIQPGIEKNVEKSVLEELAKQKVHEDKLAEAKRTNEALQRENDELKRNQKK
ncbi:hypothetical protein JAO85_17440 [Comamonas sp. NyZ500]|uniref:hypothetical protein n=1 Tax=Comamonas sp. NyZ500 TaxID=2795732 RepID=UPI00192C4F32|nr:hypothetical protein [Comamonas sp. NyZ500]MBL5979066.1 hypothetical protein [Comamonas sp. NyZ500]